MRTMDNWIEIYENLSIEEFKKENCYDTTPISEYLNDLLKCHNLQPKDVILKFNMDRSYAYQLLKGRRNPPRNFLLRIALLCHLNLEETQTLLTIGRRPLLYPSNPFDAAVLYGIVHQLNEEQVNLLLHDIGEDCFN